jgi:hypothetical protein
MSFVLAYLVFNAPPVSIRRLTCLYILAFASAAGLLTLVGAKHVGDVALMAGTAFTFPAWISPPLWFLYDVARSRTLDARVFDFRFHFRSVHVWLRADDGRRTGR